MSSPRLVLHAIGNAHIDPVWLWRWPEGLETIRSTFRSALDRMNEYPGFVFTGSSAAFYAALEETDPAMLAEIAERVREGRWEIVGGWWVQPDVNVPSGESLVRQGLYGQRYFERAFGVRATAGYNPDTFGHPGTLPMILRGQGMGRYVFMRPGPHEKEIPANLFTWRAPDGSEVTTVRIPRAYCTWPEALEGQVESSAEAAPAGASDFIVFYGVGNHGGGPTKRNIESLLGMADGDDVAVTLSSLDRYFRAVAGAEPPIVDDELQHHARGCYTAHSEIKAENRRAEHLLLAAERICTVAAMQGRAYPTADLQHAWQAVLFNQFHDILAGTSLPEAYRDARDASGYACHLAARHLHSSLQSITGSVDVGPDGGIVLFNPLPWPVRVPVEIERGPAHLADASGRPLPVQAIQPTTLAGQRRCCLVADVPGLGYTTVHETAADVPAPGRGELLADEGVLQNRWWRLEIDGDGVVTRLLDRARGVELLGDAGIAALVMDDPSDTWSHDVPAFRNIVGSFGGARAAVEEFGPVRATLSILSQFGKSNLATRVSLYADTDVIEYRCKVNWQEPRCMLKVAFPWQLTGGQVTAEAPYGVICRPADGEEHPCQSWVDITGDALGSDGAAVRAGVAVINSAQYGYDALGAELRMSVLRSAIYAHHDPQVPEPGADYHIMDLGEHEFQFRILPHAGSWMEAGVARRSMEMHEPVIAVNESGHGGTLAPVHSLLSVGPDCLVPVVVKQAEEGSRVVLRAWNTAVDEVVIAVKADGMAEPATALVPGHSVATWSLDLAGSLLEPINLLESGGFVG